MAFEVVYSENDDSKQEMNELLQYHQKKMLYMETKAAGKNHSIWALYLCPYNEQKRRGFDTECGSHNKISQKCTKSKSKQKSPNRKILSFNSSFWNNEKG